MLSSIEKFLQPTVEYEKTKKTKINENEKRKMNNENHACHKTKCVIEC